MAEVLVGGAAGGREVALVEALRASSEVTRVEVSADIWEGLERFSGRTKPFVVIGPEAPLVGGMADTLRGEGYTAFGPGRKAAGYEASKAFATRMMQRHGVPHAPTAISDGPETDEEFLSSRNPEDYVIKWDGLAKGKGVILPATVAEARETVRAMRAGVYGDGEKPILFSKRLSGPEVSIMAVVGDNDEFAILPLAQDYKRLGDGDTGPNTGGMGACAPVPESIVSPRQYELVRKLTALSLAGMRADGVPYARGLLYVGGVLADQLDGDPAVYEFNVRFGDPETQVVVPLLTALGVDVYRLLRSAAEGVLEKPSIDFGKLSLSALTVCLAAAGYPDSSATRLGDRVYGLTHTYPAVRVQQAAVENGKTNGGRVLYVTGIAPDLQSASDFAYGAIDTRRKGWESGKIGFEGMQFRRDIGRHPLQRTAS